MKNLLNVLYVTQPKAYLYKDGQNVVVSVDQKEVFRIPIINIEGIVSFGYMGCSPGLMQLCVQSKVSLAFMTPAGKFISRIQGYPLGNVVLRRMQYRLADDEDKTLAFARLMIAAKICNYRAALKRYLRDYGDNANVESATQQLRTYQKKALRVSDKSTLRGIEGMAATAYFKVFPFLLTQQKDSFAFNGRNRRPPRDEINAMLSFAYSILTNEVASALESVGLDPYLGMFHAMRSGRVSLALDVIEEFRAYMCDRFVLSLINRRQIQPSDFLRQGSESVVMTDRGRKIFLSQWQERKREVVTHPYLKEKIPLGLFPYVQCVLLARTIRGEYKEYVPFIMK